MVARGVRSTNAIGKGRFDWKRRDGRYLLLDLCS